MRRFWQKSVTLLAIYAVALNLVFLGYMPVAAAASDPFSAICHSGAAVQNDDSGGKPASAPAHACEHCNLCSIASPPAPDVARHVALKPSRLLHVLVPASTPARIGTRSNPELARGPPRSV